MPVELSSAVPRAKCAKRLALEQSPSRPLAIHPARVANPRASLVGGRTAPSACYRSALVHPPSSRSRPHLRLRAVGSFGVAVALLAATGCMDGSTPYEDRRPATRESQPEVPARVATAPSHGFNDAIAWRHLDEGLAEAKNEGRPLMLVVHASWCSRCQELKPAFSDARLAELSERFVMVNADQDEIPAVTSYAPDGKYIPRVLFIDPATGSADEALQNPGRERYHYYYGPQDDLPGMMEKALVRHEQRS